MKQFLFKGRHEWSLFDAAALGLTFAAATMGPWWAALAVAAVSTPISVWGMQSVKDDIEDEEFGC